MSDNESSHLMWIIIVVAIVALVFMGLNVAFPGLISDVTDKMKQGVKGIDVGDDTGFDVSDYLESNSSNGNGIVGLKENAFINGKINPKLVTLKLPNEFNNKPLVTIDFSNSSKSIQWKGVKKIVGNSNLKTVTSLQKFSSNPDWSLESLDLSNTKVSDLGSQYFMANNKTVKSLILGGSFKSFGYSAFDNSALEYLKLTNKSPLTSDLSSLSTIPKNQVTVSAPKELKSQLDPYKNNFKELSYY